MAGIEPSVGSVGDSLDNALAQLVIGINETEFIELRGPWRRAEAVAFATLEWWTGSTTDVCSSRSATYRRSSTNSNTIAARTLQSRGAESTRRVSGEPHTVHGSVAARVGPACGCLRQQRSHFRLGVDVGRQAVRDAAQEPGRRTSVTGSKSTSATSLRLAPCCIMPLATVYGKK